MCKVAGKRFLAQTAVDSGFFQYCKSGAPQHDVQGGQRHWNKFFSPGLLSIGAIMSVEWQKLSRQMSVLREDGQNREQ